VIFYCMADGCGHEWEIDDKNSAFLSYNLIKNPKSKQKENQCF
jgi:hypothetical protein